MVWRRPLGKLSQLVHPKIRLQPKATLSDDMALDSGAYSIQRRRRSRHSDRDAVCPISPCTADHHWRSGGRDPAGPPTTT